MDSINLSPGPIDDLGYDPISLWKQNSREESSWKSRQKILKRFLEENKISPSKLIMRARKYHQGERPDERIPAQSD